MSPASTNQAWGLALGIEAVACAGKSRAKTAETQRLKEARGNACFLQACAKLLQADSPPERPKKYCKLTNYQKIKK